MPPLPTGGGSSSFNDLLILKLAKLVVWHLTLWILALVLLNVSVTVTKPGRGASVSLALLQFLLQYALQTSVIGLQFLAVTKSDASPLLLPSLIWRTRSPVWIRLIRTQHMLTYLRHLALWLACLASAVTTAYLSTQKRGIEAWIWSLTYGGCLSVAFSTYYLFSSRGALSYPSIQRTTYFRVKQRLPALFKQTLVLSTISVLMASAACYAIAMVHGISAAVAKPELKGAVQCLLGWLLAVELLEVVVTEPLLDQLGLAPMQAIKQLKAAMASPSTLQQELALMELAIVAEDRNAARTALRHEVFSDDSGGLAWGPLASSALTEVRDCAAAISEALPSMAGDAGKKVIQWNVVQLASMGKSSATLQQFSALLHARSRYQRVVFAARFLAGMLVAAGPARGEDRYSVVLIREPRLADVVVCMASCLLALQQFNRSTGSIVVKAFAAASGPVTANSRLRSSSHAMDSSMVALEDVVRRLLLQLSLTYGPNVQHLWRDAKLKAPYGTPQEIAVLLKSIAAVAE